MMRAGEFLSRTKEASADVLLAVPWPPSTVTLDSRSGIAGLSILFNKVYVRQRFILGKFHT